MEVISRWQFLGCHCFSVADFPHISFQPFRFKGVIWRRGNVRSEHCVLQDLITGAVRFFVFLIRLYDLVKIF